MGYYADYYEVLKVNQTGPELVQGRYVTVRKPHNPDGADAVETSVILWGGDFIQKFDRSLLRKVSPEQEARVLYLMDAERVASAHHEALFLAGGQLRAEADLLSSWVHAILGHEFDTPFMHADLTSYQAHIQANADPRIYDDLNQDALRSRWAAILRHKAKLDKLEAQALA